MSNSTGSAQWTMVDEGWGRKAADFSTLSELGNCREYVAMHHLLGVDAGDRLLDVACGSGLAIELARLRGALCSGIDASARLVAVACDRNPGSDIRVGDMHALPWDQASFDVVTSFRGIWGTTPDAVAEIRRVLRPGGARRYNGVGSHQGVSWRLGAGTSPPCRCGKGGQPGCDGVARPARCG
jgi:SAM-dependent methyltransferase